MNRQVVWAEAAGSIAAVEPDWFEGRARLAGGCVAGFAVVVVRWVACYQGDGGVQGGVGRGGGVAAYGEIYRGCDVAAGRREVAGVGSVVVAMSGATAVD